jgi:hypothetical protein
MYYLIELVRSTGCEKIDSVLITVNPLPQPTSPKPPKTCPGDTLNLGYAGTPGDTYQWTSIPPFYSSTLPTIQIYPISGPNDYILTETNPVTGCSNSDTILVSVYPFASTPHILSPSIYCANDTPFTAYAAPDSGYAYTWAIYDRFGRVEGQIISGQGTDSIRYRGITQTAVIMVTGISPFGCTSSISHTLVNIFHNPDAHFTVHADSPLYQFKAFDKTESAYSWNFGDGSSIIGPDSITHQYHLLRDSLINASLKIIDLYGCTSIFDTTIAIHYFPPPSFRIQVYPNPFDRNATVKIELVTGAHIGMVMYDAIGRYIGKFTDQEQAPGVKEYNLNAIAENLAPGVYFLEILVDGKVYVRPLVKE